MDQLHQINVEYEGLEKTGELAEDCYTVKIKPPL